MKKYLNYKTGFWCLVILIFYIIFCSYTYSSNSWTYTVSSVRCNGHNYVVATSNTGAIAITHDAGCN